MDKRQRPAGHGVTAHDNALVVGRQSTVQLPQYVDFGRLTAGDSLSSGPQGVVQDYYLDFRRHLHAPLWPLAYLIVVASTLALAGFASIFHRNLVRSLDVLLAGVRRVNEGNLQTTIPIQYRDEIGFLTESFNRAVAEQRDLVANLETRVATRTVDLAEANALLRQEMDERQAAQAQVVVQQRALAAAEERERMSRELHDGLGQVMGYVNVQAQAIRALLQSGQTDPAVSVARQLEQVAQDAHADVRAYILGIRTDAAVSATGFPAALRLYLDALERAYGFRVTLDLPLALETSPGTGLFAPEVEAQLLRIVQEGLTNVRKHAGVDRGRVSLTLAARQAAIVIADAGVGFEIADCRMQNSDPLRKSQIQNRQSAITSASPSWWNGRRRWAAAWRWRRRGGTRVTVRMPLAVAAGAGVQGLRVLLADDHPLFLDGLRNMLTVHGLNVVGLAHDGSEAQEQAATLRPDLILLDIQMPRCDGLEAARQIKASLPDTTIVMLTVSATEESLFGALKAGASGYILKSASSEHFFDTLASLLRGEVVFSPEVAALILADFAPAATTPSPKTLPGLTERQTEVLRLVARGLTYKEVGARLHVAEVTVKYHMGEILNHLHVQTRKEAVAYAVRSGLDRP
ncbi:MAG: response regulator [Chloroflexi bacterium]|nr:response regulator [Chloroflexota bacterium]